MKYKFTIVTIVILLFVSHVLAQDIELIGEAETIETSNLVAFPESIAVSNGVAYVSNFFDGAIYAVNLEDGSTELLVEAGTNDVVSGWGLTIEAETGLLLACGNRTQGLGEQEITNSAYAVNVETGEIVEAWDLPDGVACNSIAVDSSGNIYISDVSPNADIVRIDRETGESSIWIDDPSWENETGFGLGGLVVDENDTIYMNANGPLFRIEINDDGTAGEIIPQSILDADGNELPFLGFDGFATQNNMMYGAAFDFETNQSLVVQVTVIDEMTVTTEVIFNQAIGITGIWANDNIVYAVDGQILQGLSIEGYEPDIPFSIYAIEIE
ncbi:MAG: hypothetical protein AAF846_05835 [Chloroflexota bacterium]